MRPIATPFDLDRNLVELIRGLLEQSSPAERAYAKIKSNLLPQGKEFTVDNAAGPDARQALIRISDEPLTRGVPAMFSPDGYYKAFLPAQAQAINEQEDEFWIFGTSAAGAKDLDTTALANKISNMYFQDYIQTWNRFLADIRIRPFNNFTEAAEILRVITGDNSPLVLLLQGAAENTKLMPDIPGIGGGEEDDSLLGKVGEMFSSNDAESGPSMSPAVVDEAFASLHHFVQGKESQSAQIDGIRNDVRELYSFINLLARSGTGAATAGAQQEMSGAVNRIRTSASYAPQPLSQWIAELADQSEGLVAGNTMSALDARWRSEVVPFCRKAIANRYPFAPTGEAEVSLQDFGQFFGPGGKLDMFFKSNLSAYVNTNTSPWRVEPSVSDIIRINSSALKQMELAREIQQAFFAAGGNLPSATFDLKPVGMDPNTTHFMLNIDGQRLNYSHGPLVSESLNWPSSSSFSQVQIQFSPETAMGGSRTENGAWAWFRMLDNATIERGATPEQFKLTFKLADRWITYELRARSAYNPFNLSQLRSFECVPNL
jgi:type VI secretion system protein ImpL